MFSNQQNRLITNYSNVHIAGAQINTDSFFEDLLLNDQIVIISARFNEIAEIIKKIGIDSTHELIKHGFIEILLDPMFAGFRNVNHYEQPLQKDEHNLVVMRMAEPTEYIHSAFLNLENSLGYANKKFIKLKGSLVKNLVRYDDNANQELLDQTRSDLPEGQFPIQILEYVLVQNKIPLCDNFNTKIRASISWETENLFKFESNLRDLLGIDETTTTKIIQESVFGIASCNQKILEMREFDSINEFRENELFTLGRKLDRVASLNSHQSGAKALNRVLSLKGLPEIKLSANYNIDINKFIKIKQSKECTDFREWLRTINNNTSDKEILDYINNFKAKISNSVNSGQGKIIRFLANTVIGVFNSPASIGLGAVDTFVADKILPQNGVVSFVNNKIPSIFKQ